MFPATTVGQAVYQTVAIQNIGNEPTLYSIHEDYDKYNARSWNFALILRFLLSNFTGHLS